MGHHRFIAQFEITLEEPGNQDKSDPDPMPADLVTNLINEINTKAQPKDKGGKPYKVERTRKK